MPFPLPFTAFEEYMLADDRPTFPMNFFVGLRFEGRVAPEALVAAVRHARRRHPLLSAVAWRARRRWFWTPAGADFTQVHWTGQPPRDGFPACGPIDLAREPGLKVVASVGDDSLHLDLQFHHAACDGMGAFQFVRDLLVGYAAAVEGDIADARLRPLDLSLLAGRGKYGLTPARFLRILPKQLVGLLGVRQFLMRKPVALTAEPSRSRTLPAGYPAVVTGALDRDTTERFWDVATRLGVTANDQLLRDLFIAIDAWRNKRGEGQSSDWLRLAVPMNLRSAADRRLPAANVATMVFLDRQPCDVTDARALLSGVKDEMQLIKRLRLGLTFPFSLAVARWTPGGLARMARQKRGMSTAVLTNLGDPLAKARLPRREGRLVTGGLTLEGLELAAPIRPHTAAAFAVWKDAGALHATLHFDPRRISSNEADELLDRFLRQLHDTAQGSRTLELAR
jgi:hypothetical protein